MFRKRSIGHRAEVTSVELFFDLVFVIAVTQISHALLEHLTWLGALEAALLLGAVWWAWIDTAWITNWLDPQHPLVRLMLFFLMAVGLVLSSSIPEAFGERGLAFAVAFVVFQLSRTLFMLWASRSDEVLFRNFTRILIWYCLSSLFWLAGGFAAGEMRLGLWLVAVALDTLGPILAFWIPGLGRSDTREWQVDGAHIAERTGLFVMIALGESLLVIGVAFADLPWSSATIAATAIALLQSIAMWWLYFSQHAETASHAIATSDDPGRIARQAYTYVPVLLIAGIVVSAVGDDLVLHHPFGHMDTATILVLIGGPALFLLGAGLFKLAVFGRGASVRLVGLVATLALFPFAGQLSPLLLSAATSFIMVVVAGWESIALLRHPERQPGRPRSSTE